MDQSVVPCEVLTVASCSAYRLPRRQVRWSGISISKNFPQFIMIHTVKGFSIVNEAEVNIFLEFYFLCDPMDVAILISGSSAFSTDYCRRAGLGVGPFLIDWLCCVVALHFLE